LAAQAFDDRLDGLDAAVRVLHQRCPAERGIGGLQGVVSHGDLPSPHPTSLVARLTASIARANSRTVDYRLSHFLPENRCPLFRKMLYPTPSFQRRARVHRSSAASSRTSAPCQ